MAFLLLGRVWIPALTLALINYVTCGKLFFLFEKKEDWN
jgi:hypothetical protein